MQMVESHHPDLPNIVGGHGCLTAYGTRCFGCCRNIYRIHGSDGRIFKNPEDVCQYVTPEGCGIHNSPEQPPACKSYHCSKLVQTVENPLLPRDVRLETLDEIWQLLEVLVEQQTITPEFALKRYRYLDWTISNSYQPSMIE